MPGFAPPEQYGQGTDARSDIYVLGATLYASLTTQNPEDALSRMTTKILLTPVRKYNPEIPQAIAQVIEKALRTAVKERHQSAEEFKQALINAAHNNEKVFYLISQSTTGDRRRNTYLIIGAVLGIVLLCFIVAAGFYLLSDLDVNINNLLH
jgi:serine/threonine protein kinase